ncbi:YadA-like family protein, partial [Bartonella clarridgeiae]
RTDLSKFGTNISSYLGGGADLVAGKAPIYRIQGKELHNVGSAFANVDTTLTQIQNDMSENIDNVEQNGLLWNDSENAFVALHGEKGKEKTESKLKFLLGGNIAKGSTEAITGGQLYETHTKLASYFGGGAGYKHGKWIDPTFKVVQFDSDSKTDGRKYVQYNNIDGAIGGVNKNMEDLDSRLNDVQAEVNNNGLHWNKEIGAYDATHGADKGKITNVADGKLEEGSSDVVTGNQLFETNQNIIGLSDDVKSLAENTSTYLGGGADLSAGKAPTYKIQDESYNNVGAAFAGVDTTLTQLQKDMTANIENVEQNGLLWSDSENAFVALHGEKGKEKTESKLKFLLGGDIAEGSTEAITGNQLYETHTKLASYFGGEAGYNNGVWTSPTFKVVQFNFGDNTDGKKYNQYHNVADAFGGVNESMENLNDRLGNIEQKKEQNGIKWNEEKGAYDASQKGEDGKITNSKLTGVADGAIEKNSSDVVTGNQLWETNQKVDKLEDKVNKFENSVDQMTEGTVQYDKDGDGKKTNKITLVGGDADKPVVIDNVADGKVEKGSKEAINGGQLHEKIEIVLDDAKKYTDEKITDAVSKAKDYTDMKFDILNYNIDGAKQEARQAAAIGLAVSNLRYNEAPGKLSIAISSGVWRSQSAFAFGAGYTSENGNIRSNISVTTAGDHWGVGGGIQFTLN